MIDIKSGPLVPWHFRFVGLLVLVVGIALLLSKLLLAFILIVIGLFFVSAYEGTEIDEAKKVYREYTSFFFLMKTGKTEGYESIERLFITRGKESQQMYTAHTTHSSTFENVVYNGYVKFSNGEKIHLLSEKNKDKLIKKLIPLKEALSIDIVDHA